MVVTHSKLTRHFRWSKEGMLPADPRRPRPIIPMQQERHKKYRIGADNTNRNKSVVITLIGDTLVLRQILNGTVDIDDMFSRILTTAHCPTVCRRNICRRDMCMLIIKGRCNVYFIVFIQFRYSKSMFIAWSQQNISNKTTCIRQWAKTGSKYQD